MSEAQIIDSILNRNQSGLSYLYDNYSPALFGVICRILGNEKVAEEVLSQTFMKIWDKIDTYDSAKSTLFTWIMTIARNTAIDKKRLKSFNRNEKTKAIDSTVNNIESDNSFQLDKDRLIANLDQKYRDVVERIYLLGYTQLDVSKELEIPLGTVKTRLRKAILILREEFKNEKNLLLGFFSIIIIITIITLL